MKTHKVKPFVLLINGPIGAGKTTLASYLKKKLPNKTVFLDMDIIKYFINSFQKNISYHNLTRRVMIDMINSYIAKNINVVISSSWTVVLIKELKIKIGKINYIHLFLKTKLENSIKRARSRKKCRTIRDIKKNCLRYSAPKFKDAIFIDANKKIPAVRKDVMKILKGKII